MPDDFANSISLGREGVIKRQTAATDAADNPWSYDGIEEIIAEELQAAHRRNTLASPSFLPHPTWDILLRACLCEAQAIPCTVPILSQQTGLSEKSISRILHVMQDDGVIAFVKVGNNETDQVCLTTSSRTNLLGYLQKKH